MTWDKSNIDYELFIASESELHCVLNLKLSINFVDEVPDSYPLHRPIVPEIVDPDDDRRPHRTQAPDARPQKPQIYHNTHESSNHPSNQDDDEGTCTHYVVIVITIDISNVVARSLFTAEISIDVGFIASELFRFARQRNSMSSLESMVTIGWVEWSMTMLVLYVCKAASLS